FLDYRPAPDSEACSTLHREDRGFLSPFLVSVASRSAPGFLESISASPVTTLWVVAVLPPAPAGRKPVPPGAAAAPFSPRAHEPSRVAVRSEGPAAWKTWTDETAPPRRGKTTTTSKRTV